MSSSGFNFKWAAEDEADEFRDSYFSKLYGDRIRSQAERFTWREATAAAEPVKPREKTPELRALLGGFVGAMSAAGWKLRTVNRGTCFDFEWRRGSVAHAGWLICPPAASDAPQKMFSWVCLELAKREGLRVWAAGIAKELEAA